MVDNILSNKYCFFRYITKTNNDKKVAEMFRFQINFQTDDFMDNINFFSNTINISTINNIKRLKYTKKYNLENKGLI